MAELADAADSKSAEAYHLVGVRPPLPAPDINSSWFRMKARRLSRAVLGASFLGPMPKTKTHPVRRYAQHEYGARRKPGRTIRVGYRIPGPLAARRAAE